MDIPLLFNLTDLINRYPGIKQNGFSTETNFVASSIITPQIISSAQATYNPARDAKPISLIDLKRNAASLRQNNAVKAVGNLLFIIQKLNNALELAKTNLVDQ